MQSKAYFSSRTQFNFTIGVYHQLALGRRNFISIFHSRFMLLVIFPFFLTASSFKVERVKRRKLSFYLVLPRNARTFVSVKRTCRSIQISMYLQCKTKLLVPRETRVKDIFVQEPCSSVLMPKITTYQYRPLVSFSPYINSLIHSLVTTKHR